MMNARNCLRWTVMLLTLVGANCARAQFAPPDPGTAVRDASALAPPVGERVAIVEFLDLQCPDCARANPVVAEAAAAYGIPVIRHDFPLPFHSWSLDAAVAARWFDKNSVTLGNSFRDAVFANQAEIKSREDLAAFAKKYASDHQLTLPAPVDPDGRLLVLVKADYALGQRIGVEHTPTIWVVTAQSKGAPFVEVIDRTRLHELIEQAKANTK